MFSLSSLPRLLLADWETIQEHTNQALLLRTEETPASWLKSEQSRTTPCKENLMRNIERKIKMMVAASMLLVGGFAYSQMAGQAAQPSQQAQPPAAASPAGPSNEVQDALKQISTELNLTED
jgi:hypothetical protein